MRERSVDRQHVEFVNEGLEVIPAVSVLMQLQ